MESNWLWVLLAVVLVGCCVLPMMFMGKHRHNNRREGIDKTKSADHH